MRLRNKGGFCCVIYGQRRELFLGAGAEMFSDHFSMRIGSSLPGRDVMSARVSENSGDSCRK